MLVNFSNATAHYTLKFMEMNQTIIVKVKEELQRYKAAHKGERPLYIVVPEEEGDKLLEEVKDHDGFDQDIVVTTFEGVKIVKHGSLKPGDILLSNELPDTGS
jgi:hypothetical protein